MSREFSVVVVGATGAVGETMVSLLAQRKFPCRQLRLLASERSVGRTMEFGDREIAVENLTDADFQDVDIALFSAGAEVARAVGPRAAAAGAVVIDNSSGFRADPDIPLVVPEVNGNELAGFARHRIIANPNCSTIQLVVVLNAIQQLVPIERVDVSTYQSASGAGAKGLQELADQTSALLGFREITGEIFGRQLAFNVIPQIGAFEADGYTGEELKVRREARRILGLPHLAVNVTAVRVPVMYGHSEAVTVTAGEPITSNQVREALRRAAGVTVMDHESNPDYPTAVTDAAGRDDVYVGRIRSDLDDPRRLNLWVVADNIRKGAALNAVQIAESLVNHHL